MTTAETKSLMDNFAKIIPISDEGPGDESRYKELEAAIYGIKNKDTARKALKFLADTVFKEIINDYKDGIIKIDTEETDIKIKDTFNFKDKEGLRASLFIKNNGSLLIKITGLDEDILIKGHVFDLIPEGDRIIDSPDDEEEEDEDEEEDTSSDEETEEATTDTTEEAAEEDNAPTVAAMFKSTTLQQLKHLLVSEIDQDTYDRCQFIQSYYSEDHDMVVTIAKTEVASSVIDKIINHGTFDEVFDKFMDVYAEYENIRDDLYTELKTKLINPALAAEYDNTLQGACKAEVSEESSEDRIQRTNRHLGRKKPDDDTLNSF